MNEIRVDDVLAKYQRREAFHGSAKQADELADARRALADLVKHSQAMARQLEYLTATVMPGKLWDGNNPYCSRPGMIGSEYQHDLIVADGVLRAGRAALLNVIGGVK